MVTPDTQTRDPRRRCICRDARPDASSATVHRPTTRGGGSLTTHTGVGLWVGSTSVGKTPRRASGARQCRVRVSDLPETRAVSTLPHDVNASCFPPSPRAVVRSRCETRATTVQPFALAVVATPRRRAGLGAWWRAIQTRATLAGLHAACGCCSMRCVLIDLSRQRENRLRTPTPPPDASYTSYTTSPSINHSPAGDRVTAEQQ